MAYSVKFAKGSQLAYNSLVTKDNGTLYFITDSETPAFYLGEQKLSSLAEVATLAARCDGEDGEIGVLKSALSGIDITKEGEVKSVIDNFVAEIMDDIGTVSTLKTTNKTLVTSVNEIYDTITQDRDDLTITVVSSSNPESGLLRSYDIKQGGVTKGIISIPQDLLVKSGRVVTVVQNTQDPSEWDALQDSTDTGAPFPLSQWAVVGSTTGETITNSDIKKAGTYVELTINVASGTDLADQKIYIDVSKLIDAYTVEQSATQIQLSIVGYNISARVVAGSIGSTELSTDAVTTYKIANENVTKNKLERSVQTSLEKADSAVQEIIEGINPYEILVDGNAVRVHGLDSAAQQPVSYFDRAGEAANVLGQQGDAVTANTVFGAHAHADLAEQNAKTYTDQALTWGSIGTTTNNSNNDNQQGGE